jgi:O-antigen/teichoic acid export membrane protein/HEAT repeat protein
MISPQPPVEAAASAEYGGQLDRESLKTATLSGARWVGATRIVAESLALGTTVLLARLISPAEYGTAVVVLILPMLASILTFEGFGAFLVQARTCTREHVRSAVLLSIVSGIVLSLLVFFLSPLVAEPIFGSGTSHLAQLCAPIFLIASFGEVPRALLERRLDWKWLNLTEIIQLIVVSVTSVAFAFAGLGSEALILGAILGAAAVTGVLLTAAPSGLPIWDKASAKLIVKFGVPAAVAGLSATLHKNITILVLGSRLSPGQVGLYWRAYQLGVVYQTKVSYIAGRVAKPVLTRAERMEDLREMRTRLLRVNTTLVFPLLALLIVLAPDIVPWVYGPDWGGAVKPTQVLAVAGMWTILIVGMDAPLMAVGRPGALATFNVVMMTSTGVTAWFTAPLGITAVAVGVAVSQLVMLLAGQFFLLRRVIGIPLRESLGDSAAALACSGVLIITTLPVADVLRGSLDPLALMLLIASLGLAVYGVSLRMVSPSALGDLRTLSVRVLRVRPPLGRLRLRGSARRAKRFLVRGFPLARRRPRVVGERKPNINALVRGKDVDGLLAAASYQELAPTSAGAVSDLGVPVRADAILALGTVAPEQGRSSITAGLRDRADRVRCAAIRVLHARHEGDLLVEALRWLPGESRSRTLAMQAIINLRKSIRPSAVVDALVHHEDDDFLGERDVQLILALLEQAGADAADEVLELLVMALDDERGIVVDRAAELLVRLGPDSIEPLVAELRTGSSPGNAAHVLGRIGEPETVDVLVTSLRHGDARVRAESAAALGELHDPMAVEALLRATRDPEHTVRSHARAALDRMGTVAVIEGVAELLRPAVREAVHPAIAQPDGEADGAKPQPRSSARTRSRWPGPNGGAPETRGPTGD